MTDDFQSLSNKVANDFIQSVVFIDDKAYKKPDTDDPLHDFDVESILRTFAQDKKICSVFQPKIESDIELFSSIAEKADVVVLDWKMIIESPSEDPSSDEEDDEDDDIRGKYSKLIISSLLNSKSSLNSLKLIIVYTGETDLSEIADEILSDLNKQQIGGFQVPERDSCCVESMSCKILIRAKFNGGEKKGKHKSELLNYDDLPKFINEEFSKMTEGLLPIFALKSLSAIRRNYYQILNIFSKELDTAYLTNQSLLPNTEDANELLVELLGDTFSSILRANNLNNVVDEKFIGLWIDSNIEEKDKLKYSAKGNKMSDTFTLTKEMIKDILKSHSDVEEKFINTLTTAGVSKTSIEKRKYTKYAFDLFHEEVEQESMNVGFAKLCQHKNLVHHESYLPSLSLGTIVKSSLGSDNYLVCIQQRCDSVRVKPSEGRRFLFLSLSIAKDKFDFITPDGEKLKLNRRSFHLRTVKFNGSENGTVQSNNEEGKFFFNPAHHSNEPSEKFEFIFELKDLYAQRIVADYSASLSRVGLDEPEWVRLNRSI